MVLKKPFDSIEVLQLADTLTQRWQSAQLTQRHMHMLQQIVADRSKDLVAVTGELNATNQLLAAATQFEQEALTRRPACAAAWPASCAPGCARAR